MPIRLTDDDNYKNDRNSSSDDRTSGNRLNDLAETAKQNKGAIAMALLLVFGIFKFPKTTLFILLVAAVLFYFYGDQELLRSWGIKK